MGENPYKSLKDHQSWRRSVAAVDRFSLDPVVAPKFAIDKQARVATAGSCFAQHISRRLRSTGFNYFVAENDTSLSPQEAKRRHYGVFSARYGNIYTTRQLLQLFDEAFADGTVSDAAWQRPDGRFADPLRPNIEPEGFARAAEVRHEREKHLACVRDIFQKSDVFVFTMGLTEAWRSRADGTVYPLAPGVAAGSYRASDYEFVNFGVADIERDMHDFLGRLKARNGNVNVLLTVSPVPLIATYTDRHVLAANTYSKSVLRVAAETLSRSYDWVDYFPSYEIITGSFNRGMYYEDDYREVNELGVSHAMRCFFENYVERKRDGRGAEEATAAIPIEKEFGASDVVCDEESIDQISR